MESNDKSRIRRSDRYKKESGVFPSEQLLQKTDEPQFVSSVSTVPKVPQRRKSPQPGENKNEDSGEKKKALHPGFIFAVLFLLIALIGVFTVSWLLTAKLNRIEEEKVQAHQRIVDAHPIYCKDIIEKYAGEYNLDPAYVCAIVLNESSFRADAESGVGARGLMQVMPDTALWVAGKLGRTNFQPDQLFQPETNIQFGCWYLNYLSQLFSGDPVLVTSAYHAGQGTVKSWLQDKALSADGISIPLESLPDGPTKSYAKKVTSDYGIYKALFYNEETAVGSLGADSDMPDNQS